MNYLMKGALLGLVVALQACSSGSGSSDSSGSSGSSDSDDKGNGSRSVIINANNLNGTLVLEVAGQRVELDSPTGANQVVEVGAEDLVTAKVIGQPATQSCVFDHEVGKATLADVGTEADLNCEDLIFFTARDNDEFRYGLWRTDGTAEGTLKIVDLPEFGESSAVPPAIGFYPVPGTMLMRMPNGQLWTTDGSAQGTGILAGYGDKTASDIGRTSEGRFLTITGLQEGEAVVKLVRVSRTAGLQETGYQYQAEPGVNRRLYPREDGLFEVEEPDMLAASTLDQASLYWRTGAGFAERTLLEQISATGTIGHFDIEHSVQNAHIYGFRQDGKQTHFSFDAQAGSSYPLLTLGKDERVSFEDEGASTVRVNLERPFGESGTRKCSQLQVVLNHSMEMIRDGCIDSGVQYVARGTAFGKTLVNTSTLGSDEEPPKYWLSLESRTLEPLPEAAHLLLGKLTSFKEAPIAGEARLFFVVSDTDEPTGTWVYANARFELFTATSLAGPFDLIFSADKAIASHVAFDPFWTSSSSLRIHDRHLFKSHMHETGTELWITDGTVEGTQLLRDINPGSGSSQNLSVAELGLE